MIQHQEYEDFLAHYGVKGMKWGVRRSRRVQAAKNMYRKRESDRVAQFKRERSALYANAKKEWKTPGNGVTNKVAIVGATALRRDLLNGDHVRAISRNKKLRRQEIRAARKADRADKRRFKSQMRDRIGQNNDRLDRDIERRDARTKRIESRYDRQEARYNSGKSGYDVVERAYSKARSEHKENSRGERQDFKTARDRNRSAKKTYRKRKASLYI